MLGKKFKKEKKDECNVLLKIKRSHSVVKGRMIHNVSL